jgi:hypothetical protein
MVGRVNAQAASEHEPQRRGRPTDREVPRTTLDAWIVAHGLSSSDMVAACAKAADRLAVSADQIPSRKGVDDMRAARYYPSLVAAFLISEATGGEVGLEQWARDTLKYGKRQRKP